MSLHIARLEERIRVAEAGQIVAGNELVAAKEALAAATPPPQVSASQKLILELGYSLPPPTAEKTTSIEMETYTVFLDDESIDAITAVLKAWRLKERVRGDHE